MGKLSDILEAALPTTSSPVLTHSPSPEQIPRAPASAPPLQRSRKYNTIDDSVSSYGDLAKEFGVDAHLVEALAQRLSRFP